MAQADHSNQPLQQRMARSLIDAGLDEAIEFAALNGWNGVLGELRRIRPKQAAGDASSEPGEA